VPDKPKFQYRRATASFVKKLYVKKSPSSKANWFQSIKAALNEASARKYRLIHITVHPGNYSEHLRITRPTTILAKLPNSVVLTGSISNGGGHYLSLTNLRMNNCRPYALIQRGGRLLLKDFSIHGTRRTARDAHSGIAMDLGDGVMGHLTNVALNANQGLALYIHGQQTKVKAFRLTAMHNKINPKMAANGLTERVAAVEVANGARLLAKNPVIEDNECFGLFLRHGGQAHLRDGRVTNTKGYGEEEIAGHNVVVIVRSRLELRNMYIAGAGYCGLQIFESWAKASDTIIENNYTGLLIGDYVEPGYDPLPCLVENRTQIRNNVERDFDFTSRAVPDRALPEEFGGEEEEHETICPGVPWDF